MYGRGRFFLVTADPWADSEPAIRQAPPGLLEQLQVERMGYRPGPSNSGGPSTERTTSAGGPRDELSGDALSDRLLRYGTAALKNAAKRVAEAIQGDRNSTLNREAHGLGRLVGAGILDEEEVRRRR